MHRCARQSSASLDVDLLAAVGAGSDNTVNLDQAQIRSPSDPGYVPNGAAGANPNGGVGIRKRPGRRDRLLHFDPVDHLRARQQGRQATRAGPRRGSQLIRPLWQWPTPRPTSSPMSASPRPCWRLTRWRCTAMRWSTTGWTRWWAGARPVETWQRSWLPAIAARRWRRPRYRRRRHRRPSPYWSVILKACFGHRSDGDYLDTGCPRAGVRRVGAGSVELDRYL